MTLGEKIKLLRKSNKITQEALAKEINVDRSSIGKYETGTTPSMDILIKIASYFNVTTDYLLGNKNTDVFSINGIEAIKTKKLPILGNIACGEPIYAEEEFTGYISVDEDLQADFCLYAKGDSMIGAGIKDGSIVFIKQQDSIENGKISVVLIDNEATLKRVYIDEENKRLILNPCNDKYAPIIIEEKQLESGEVRILGKAVACQFKIK